MKKLLILWVLLLQSLADPFLAYAQAQPSSQTVFTAYCKAEITNFVPDESSKRYYLSLSLMRPATVRYLVLQVWDEERGQLPDPATGQPDRRFDLLNQTQRIVIDGANLENGRAYLLKVRAVDENGFACPTEKAETVLAALSFTPDWSIPLPVISAVTPDYANELLVIDVDLPTPQQRLLYTGHLNDEGGQRLLTIPEELLKGRQIALPLPSFLRSAPPEKSYQLTLVFSKLQDGAPTPLVYKFTPPPPPLQTRWGKLQSHVARLWQALLHYPLIFGAILAVLLSLLLWLLRASGRHPDPLAAALRPPMNLPPQSPKMNMGHEERSAEADQVAPRPMPKTKAAIRKTDRSNTGASQSPAHVRLRVIRTPDAAVAGEAQITRFPFVIGRQSCDFNIPGDSQLSRQHLEVTQEDGIFYLKDVSRNGSFIDNKRLASAMPISLTTTTVVRLGLYTFLELEPVI